MARSTWEGSTLVEEQAEPVEQAMPIRSRLRIMASPSQYPMEMLTLFASRFSGWPLSLIRSIRSKMPRISLSRSAAIRAPSSDMNRSASSTAFASPTIPGHVVRGGPTLAFLLAAVHVRLQAGPLPDVEGADPLGAVKLVRREAEQIHVEITHGERHMPEGLDGIGVKTDAALTGDLPDLGDGLQRADLIVGVHDAHEDRPARDRLRHILRIHETLGIHGEKCHLEALPFQEVAGLHHGVVLDGRGDDVISLLAVGPGDPLDCKIVALRPAARENDLGGLRPQKGGHLFSCVLDGERACWPKEWMLEGFPKVSRK